MFNKEIALKKGVFYALVEFYFSGITPSSTGGQPAELYYMTKDKIPVRTSTIALILTTIYFKVENLGFNSSSSIPPMQYH